MNPMALNPGVPIVWSLWTRRFAAQLALIVTGVVALTASAKLQIPWWPVPMTMQTYVVLVIGMAYGTHLGLATMLAYLAAGALGLPVFAGTPEKGIGLAYMAGPTGGYLLGFVAATWICGGLTARGWDRDWLRSFAAMTVGHVVILALGVAWLAALMGASRAIELGLMPFIAATIAKTLLAGATLPAAWRAVSSLRD